MITAHAVELRVGARVLLDEASFRIAAGDRIGLVGRNGAGKTTLTKTLAGETQPTAGQIDDLLDEIDDVLEENAEDFVRAYVQKGGQ